MNKVDLENQTNLNLQYNSDGLLPAIVQDAETGEILMMAYVNKHAFSETIDSGYATFWSRSRNQLWKKGETSGNRMKITDILIDCDQDCILYKVEKTSGGACHTKNKAQKYRNSCFYRRIDFLKRNLAFIDE
ncbi:MAG TPA: phosphoribosyl-AMP cyclohydrolase [Bacteroidales bacterium]|jgi:phosphoribosyl-AMP cyclohydrolase|nr:phosphoribosyl-AMP cyclohydrolase [Bacteroidales bacterium]